MSGDVAARTPGVVERIGPEPRWRGPQDRRVQRRLAWGFLAATVLTALLPSPWRYIVPWVCFAASAASGWAAMSQGPTPHSLLSVYQWEMWPTIVDEIGPPDSEGRATVVFTLLRPDGRPHGGARFVVRWPSQIADGFRRLEHTDLWFAGDVRFGGVVALPGGLHPVMAPVHGFARRRGTDAENALAIRAGYRRIPQHADNGTHPA